MTEIIADERIAWLPATFDDGVRIGRTNGQVIVEWPGRGRLLSSTSGTDSQFFPSADVHPALLAKFRATSLMACRRYLAGCLSLHGSAVAFPFGGIALVGECCSGKSTTAMALVEQHGGTFLADDVVPVDWEGSIPVVPPVDDSFWLTGDACSWFGLSGTETAKRPCRPRARCAEPEWLRAVVHLTFDDTVDGVDMQPVIGHEAFTLLSTAQICFSTGEDEDTLRNFAARARLVDATRIFRLRRRRTMENLKIAGQFLAECMSSLCSF